MTEKPEVIYLFLSEIGTRSGIWRKVFSMSVGLVLSLDASMIAGGGAMPTRVITATEKGGSFEIKKGESFGIALEENPTTGYVWAIHQMDEALLLFRDSRPSPPPDSLVGAGRRNLFVFEARQAGVTLLVLKHWRPWEGDDSVIDRFEVQIRIRDRED